MQGRRYIAVGVFDNMLIANKPLIELKRKSKKSFASRRSHDFQIKLCRIAFQCTVHSNTFSRSKIYSPPDSGRPPFKGRMVFSGRRCKHLSPSRARGPAARRRGRGSLRPGGGGVAKPTARWRGRGKAYGPRGRGKAYGTVAGRAM